MGRETRRVLKVLEGFVEGTVKAVTIEVAAELDERTPVKFGWARANWVPSIGEPFQGTAGTRDLAEQGVLNTSLKIEGQFQVLGYELGPPTYITNNVPYIIPLDQGHSDQAPDGFVDQSIDAGINAAVQRMNEQARRT